MTAKNSVGEQFGRLTIMERVGTTKRGQATWLCLCDCGTETIVQSGHLNSGHTKSCGCYGKSYHVKHGVSGTPEYAAWKGMIHRCLNTKYKRYKDYGARGISICNRWMNVENFIADMGKRPEGLSLDRIDNEGNYEPDNCRWATIYEQNRNRRGCIGYDEGKCKD